MQQEHLPDSLSCLECMSFFFLVFCWVFFFCFFLFSLFLNKTRRLKFKSCISYCLPVPAALQLQVQRSLAGIAFEIKRVACVSQDILYCLRISAVLLNCSAETGIFCCLLSKQVHQRALTATFIFQSRRPYVLTGEVSFSQYLFAFGLEEEAQRFSI